ncbi:MAG: glycosyltransferase family 2 protein [Myxococcota bacterium]
MSTLPRPPTGRQGWPWEIQTEHRPDQENRWPKISIVTPSFNQGPFIEETIRSVILQGYPNLEYLIIDGGSSDETLSVIRRYEPWISGWVSEEDRGQADAINKGFEKSTGELLGWLNSDDILYPGYLFKMAAAFQERPEVDFIFGDIDVGADPGDPKSMLRGELRNLEEMVRSLEVPIPQQSSMWRRRVIDTIGGLDPRWRVLLDREFFLRIAQHCRMDYVPGVGGFFRQHSQSKSTAELAYWAEELPIFYAEFFERSDLPPRIRRLQPETTAMMFLTCAHIARRVGRPFSMVRFLVRAVATDWKTIARRLNRARRRAR